MRSTAPIFILLGLVVAFASPAHSQTNAELRAYFKERIGLTQDEIAGIRNGQAVAKALKPRSPAEIFVFGAVYIKAAPQKYAEFAHDFERLRKLPEFLALGKFSDPPQTSDLRGFRFESDDIKALKNCKPGDCEVQLPAAAMENFHKLINWSAPDRDEEINRLLHEGVVERLSAYKREGNKVLGVYHDKSDPTEVPRQFEYMLSYIQALPRYLPDFHRYLLDYPNSRPANTDDFFYWAKVKFGLKPTLRVVQVVTRQGTAANEPAYAIAEKQLYSSHYFETALDLTFCLRGDETQGPPGFYLVKAMASEQAGLTGFKGSIVRKAAVGRSVSSLQKSLMVIKDTLEQRQ